MKLYKYTKYSQYLIESLQKNTIWLAPPYSLNDCHEGAFRYVATSFNTAEQLIKENPFLKNNLDNQFKDLFDNAITDEKFNDLVIGRYEIFRSLFGVVSLTEVCDSPLMWAHYGAQHTGVCLEFEVNQDIDNIHPIVYTNTIPSFTANDLLFDSQKTITSILTTKSLDWSYEREWRLLIKNGVLWDGGKSTKIPFKITSVIFGYRINDKDKLKILQALDNSEIITMMAMPSTDKYLMNIKGCDTIV